MNPELNLKQEAIDGEKARQVLDNAAFQSAWAAAEASIIDQMGEVSMRDSELHTRLILALQILGRVRKHIVTEMETGKMAEIQLQDANKVSRMFKR